MLYNKPKSLQQGVIYNVVSLQQALIVVSTTRHLHRRICVYLYKTISLQQAAVLYNTVSLCSCRAIQLSTVFIRLARHLAEYVCVIAKLMRRFKTEKIYDKQIKKETTVHVRRGKTNSMFSNSHNLKNSDLILLSI